MVSKIVSSESESDLSEIYISQFFKSGKENFGFSF